MADGNTWTKQQDLALLATRAELKAENPDATNRDIARALSAKGVYTTGDAVQKRLRRLDEAQQIDELRPADPENPFESLPEPEDGYVGFRIAFFDVETTDLKALMGRLLCVSIADNFANVTSRTIYDFEQDSIIDDRGLAVWLRDELEKYDILCGWNNRLFDIPFLNARLMRWGERPLRMDIMVMDPMYRARASAAGIRIGSSKLVNVSKFFDRDQFIAKTEIDWDTWAKAQSGDQEAMKYLVEHCEHDVLVTRRQFHHLKPLIKTVHR